MYPTGCRFRSKYNTNECNFPIDSRNQTKIAKDNTKGPPNTILSSIQSAIYESNMAVSAQSAKLKKNTKLTNNSHAENNVNSSVSNLIGNNLSKNRSRGGNNSEGEYSNIMKHLGGAFYKKSNSNMNVNNGNAKNDNKNAIISTTSRESKTRANTKSTDNSKGSSKLPSVLSSTPIIRGKQEKRNGLNSDDNIRNCQVISRSDSRRSPLLPFGLSNKYLMPSANAKGSNMGQSKNAFRSECTRSARSPVSALPIATPINSDTDYKSIFMLSYTAKDSQIESNVKNNNNIKLLPSLSSFQKLDKNNDNKMPALDVRDDIDIIGRNNENFQVFITKKPPTQSNQSECHCNKSPCDIKESRNSKNSNSIDFKKCISTIKNAKHGINCKNMRSAGGTNYSKQYMGRKMEVINEETESEAEASDINDPNYKDIQKKHKMAENMQKARRRPIEDCCTDFLSIVHDNIMQSVQKSLKQLMTEYSRQNMQQMRALQNKVNQHENKLDKIYSDLLEKMQIHTNNNNLRQQSKYVDDKRKLNKDNSLSSLQVVSVQSSFKESDSKDRGRVQNNLKYRKTIGVQCAILRRASEVKDKHKKHRNNDEFTNIPKTARGNLEDDDNTNLSAENSVEEMAVLHDDSCVELSCPKNMEELFSAVEKHRETNRKKKVLNSYHEHSDDSEENNEFFKSNKKKMNAHNDDNTNGYDVSVPDEMIVNDCNDSSHTIGENDYNINKRSLSETESNESDDQYHYDDYHQKPARYHIKERRYHSDEQLIPPNINKNEEIRKRDSSQRSMRKVEFCTCHEH